VMVVRSELQESKGTASESTESSQEIRDRLLGGVPGFARMRIARRNKALRNFRGKLTTSSEPKAIWVGSAKRATVTH
jgi:hypothetical protein